jgi:LysM repeat protein
MQITHEEAHRLIQFSMDQALKPQEKNILQTHLDDCMECRSFAKEINELEALLFPVMQKHWNLQPAPLSVEAITGKRNTPLQPSLILVTRTAMISIVFAAFVFSAWQFTVSNGRSATPMPVGVLPIPTPSGQSTSTKISFPNCEEVIYQVQENDTLESIAAQFSVSKDKIVAINNLSSETLNTKMELLIPICNSTPTGTVHPSTLTTTFTPLTGSTASVSTPGG